MKKINKILSIIFVSLIFMGLVGSFVLPKPPLIESENRHLTQFPNFTIKRLRAYFRGIDKFAKDNFPYRAQLVNSYRFIINSFGDQIDFNKAFRGKDGYLFLGNTYDRNIEKLEGRLKPEPDNSDLVKRLIDLVAIFKAKGVHTVFVLHPRKESVYPEKLPTIIKPSPTRYILPFMEKLAENGAEIIDPIALLIKKKETDNVYWRRDTHWNFKGAAFTFEAIIDYFNHFLNSSRERFPKSVPRLTSPSEVKPALAYPGYKFEPAAIYQGDLTGIGMFEELREDYHDNFHVVWSHNPQIIEERIGEPALDAIYETTIITNQDPIQKESIWVIGDSTRMALLPFFAHSFYQTTSYHYIFNDNTKLLQDYEAATIKPNYLVIVITERSF